MTQTIQDFIEGEGEGFRRKFVNLMTIVIPIEPRGEETSQNHKLVERTEDVYQWHKASMCRLLERVNKEVEKLKFTVDDGKGKYQGLQFQEVKDLLNSYITQMK